MPTNGIMIAVLDQREVLNDDFYPGRFLSSKVTPRYWLSWSYYNKWINCILYGGTVSYSCNIQSKTGNIIKLQISCSKGVGSFEEDEVFKGSFKLPSFSNYVIASFCGGEQQVTFLDHQLVKHLDIPYMVESDISGTYPNSLNQFK